MLGPVNGLFFLHTGCVSQSERMAMWNPATREFRPLPLLQTYLPPHFTCIGHEFGFGLDPLTNDYKVVSIRFVWDEELDSPFGSVVELYPFGNDSWRLLDPVLDSIRDIKPSLCASATYLNGAYYWLSNCNKIVLFDMSSEMFKEIQGPDKTESIPFCGDLVLHNDSIALFYYKCSVDIVEYLDLWVMKQEGCWSKLFTIGPLLQVVGTLGIWKNNEIFLRTSSSQLVSYDPNTHEIRNVGTQGNEEGNCLLVSGYKESLVSLKRGRGDCDPNNLSDILEGFFKI